MLQSRQGERSFNYHLPAELEMFYTCTLDDQVAVNIYKYIQTYNNAMARCSVTAKKAGIVGYIIIKLTQCSQREVNFSEELDL